MSASEYAHPVAVGVASRVELEGFDYIELHVGNAYQSMHFLRALYGFTPTAYCGLETGVRDRTSYVLQQGDIRLLVTTPTDTSGRLAQEIAAQGDAVSDIAFTVRDATQAFEEAVRRGATPVAEPVTETDDFGEVTRATIHAYGRVAHSFIERHGQQPAFLPTYRALPSDPTQPAAARGGPGLLDLDHLALAFPAGDLDRHVNFYTDVIGLDMTFEEKVVTPKSAMNSKVVQNPAGTVKLPMMEPAEGRHTSQIEEFVRYNRGPGVHHLGWSCGNIIAAVRALRAAGVEFLHTPPSYYDLLAERVGEIAEDTDALRELNILVDRDPWGYLLQIFSKPITSRPTLFVELIQREGALGFGSGNIRALFKAVEREQALRGNL